MARHGREIWIGGTTTDVVQESAHRIVAHLHRQLAHHERASMVLAGGNTPRSLYERLTEFEEVAWDRVDFFFGDERFVPEDHPDANVRMARETLLDPLHIPAAHVFAIPTHVSPQEAAAGYEHTLRQLYQTGRLTWDVVLLGMGTDGHTASLFPYGSWTTTTEESWCMPVWNAPKPPPTRITLTPAALNHAQLAVVLATGKEKAAAVSAALESDASPSEIPIRALAPSHGQVLWLLDEAAACALTQTLG